MGNIPFSQKAKFGIAITAVLGTMIGMSSTIAYFSSRQTTDANSFQTGTLEVDISQATPLNVSNWQPGESKQVEFVINNTGQLPLFARVVLDASWSDDQLGTDVIERTSVDRWIAGNWVAVSTQVQPATDPMFISTDGTENTLLALLTNGQERFRMTIQLSPNAGDEYQGKTLSGSVTVTAKQTNDGAEWPIE